MLLLDEPSAGLAPLFIKQMVEWVQELADTGIAVAWVVEQNPELILAASTRAHLMEGGRVTATFDGRDLLRPGRLRELLLEERQQANGLAPSAEPTRDPKEGIKNASKQT